MKPDLCLAYLIAVSACAGWAVAGDLGLPQGPLRPTPPAPTCWNQAASEDDRAACGATEYAAADQELNKVYGELIAKTDPALRAPLQKAERAWIAYRDEHVASIIAWTPERTPTALACERVSLARATEARTTELLSVLRDGDEVCAPAFGETDPAQVDQGLNASYRQLMATGEPGFHMALAKAERAWLAVRDAHIASVLFLTPAAKTNQGGCQSVLLARATKARADTLFVTFSQYQGEDPCKVAEQGASQLAESRAGCAAGDPKACLSLGRAHQDGWFWLPANPTAAIEPLRKACDGGEALACGDLASLYGLGRGVPKDPARAAGFYAQGCDRGSAWSCESLARLYAGGQGVPKDTAKAVETWEHGCEIGRSLPRPPYPDETVCWNLATALEGGDLLPRDEDRALAVHQKACDAKQHGSCLRAAQLLHGRARTAPGTRRMIDLYEAACGADQPGACMELGKMYRDGDGVPQDADSGLSLYKKACAVGFLPGCRAARAITGAAPPGDPDDPITEDSYILSVHMVVREGLPGVRLRFFGDDYGVVSRIDVFDEGKRAVVDHLTDPRDPNDRGGLLERHLPIVRFADLDFDGYQDIMLFDWAGATGNKGYAVWLFDPAAGRFVFSRDLTGPSNLEPHPDTQTLTTFTTGGGGTCDGERYRWVGHRLVVIRQVSQDWDASKKAYIRSIREPENGRLAVVRRETRVQAGKVTVEQFRGGRLLGVDTVDEYLQEKPSCWEP